VQRTTVEGGKLTECYDEAVNRGNENIKNKSSTRRWFGMMVDGWEAIDKTHIEGVLLKADQETFLLTAIPPDSEHHGVAVATMWEDIIETHAKAHMQWLPYFCSDNAGQCARARHILALQ
jgi:hypothetical protein